MTGSHSAGSTEAVAQAFDEQRGRLEAVAYRILGSSQDAQDAVQEAWLRLARQDHATIENLNGWLTTVVGRVCLDMLRSRKARREAPYEDHLPELVVTEDDGAVPEEAALLADSVGLALLVVLDSLRPAERLAFVLHDMFALPFEEIGRILGRSTDATKMLASRARRKVQASHRATSTARRQQREVVDAFLAAARGGDFEGLMRVLDPDVSLRTYNARGVVLRQGAAEVAEKVQHGAAKTTARRVLVNGQPGIVAYAADGRPLSVMACTVVDDRIVKILSVIDAKRLAAMDIPRWPQ